jgi:uncharacterized membrane protein
LNSSRRSVLVATSAVYAAVYVVLTLVLSPFSYGEVQLRVANVLTGLVPILGWPAIIGQGLGVFIANIDSPLGPVDLLNSLPSLFFSWVVWRLRNRSVFLGLTCYSVGLGASVGLSLVYVYKLPVLVTVLTTMVGIFVATTILGYLLYRAVTRTGVLGANLGR